MRTERNKKPTNRKKSIRTHKHSTVPNIYNQIPRVAHFQPFNIPMRCKDTNRKLHSSISLPMIHKYVVECNTMIFTQFHSAHTRTPAHTHMMDDAARGFDFVMHFYLYGISLSFAKSPMGDQNKMIAMHVLALAHRIDAANSDVIESNYLRIRFFPPQILY